jgi:DNA-binding transcriptional ArsR family regulator
MDVNTLVLISDDAHGLRGRLVGEEERLTEDDFYKILNHPARRTIIRLLHDRIELTYSELLADMKMDEGQFNFHLRLVKKLTETTPDGKYKLSRKGNLAFEMMASIESEMGTNSSFLEAPRLRWGIVARRIAAFLLDIFIFLFVSGILADPFLYQSIISFFQHAAQVVDLQPWFIHLEHFPLLGETIFRVIEGYSHIFFAVFIAFTLFDAYKGQTPGRYLLGIRVVTVSGRRLSLIESGIRNVGKVFVLPLDLLAGIIFYRKRGYIRFFDFYTQSKVEMVKEEPANPTTKADK